MVSNQARSCRPADAAYSGLGTRSVSPISGIEIWVQLPQHADAYRLGIQVKGFQQAAPIPRRAGQESQEQVLGAYVAVAQVSGLANGGGKQRPRLRGVSRRNRARAFRMLLNARRDGSLQVRQIAADPAQNSHRHPAIQLKHSQKDMIGLNRQVPPVGRGLHRQRQALLSPRRKILRNLRLSDAAEPTPQRFEEGSPLSFVKHAKLLAILRKHAPGAPLTASQITLSNIASRLSHLWTFFPPPAGQ